MDEKVSIEPQLQDRSLLAADRVTTETRRIETDAAGNVYVNVAAGSLTPSGTQDVNIVGSTITVPVSGPLTDTELRATPVPVSGTVIANQGTSPWIVDGSGVVQPVSGPLTDTELRASPVPVIGPLTNTELRASPVPVSFSTPVPVTQAFPAEDILTNQTLTTDGAVSLDPVFQLSHEVTVVVSVVGPVTGTLPTLQFTLWNVDQNGSVFDPAMSGVISTPIVPGTFTFVVKSPHLQLNWSLTGTLPSFGGVNVSAIGTQSFDIQPVSGTVNVGNFPAIQTIAISQTGTNNDVNVAGNVTVVQPTGTNLHTVVDNFPAVQPVSGTVTANQGTSPWVVSGTVTANLGTIDGAATAANQATEIASLASIDAGIPAALGQTTMAASMPVVIASNQTAVPISAASLPLPTGAATETTLATRLADATFTSRINTLGQKTMANSTPVVIASDQTVIPVSFTATAGTATVTRVATSTTVATALAANANRTGFIINTESGTTYVKFGSTATTTDYTVELAANSTYEYQGYKGNVTVIRPSGTGNIQVTEII